MGEFSDFMDQGQGNHHEEGGERERVKGSASMKREEKKEEEKEEEEEKENKMSALYREEPLGKSSPAPGLESSRLGARYAG